jgi:type II secretory pathway component HofQ
MRASVLFVVCSWAAFALAGGGCRQIGAPAPVAPGETSGTKKIDLDLENVHIRDAVRAIAQGAGVNLSADPDLNVTVTIRVQSTPWDHVLKQLTREQGLHIVKAGSVLRLTRDPNTSPVREYSGERIEASFTDTPIREAMQTFSTFAKVSIVVAPDVQVNITQALRSVPWDFALEHIARKYGLRLVQDGETIHIVKN